MQGKNTYLTIKSKSICEVYKVLEKVFRANKSQRLRFTELFFRNRCSNLILVTRIITSDNLYKSIFIGSKKFNL